MISVLAGGSGIVVELRIKSLSSFLTLILPSPANAQIREKMSHLVVYCSMVSYRQPAAGVSQRGRGYDSVGRAMTVWAGP